MNGIEMVPNAPRLARATEIARPAALAENEGRDGDAVADAIIFSAFEEGAVPRPEFDQVSNLAPRKTGIGRDAGMNDGIVAMIEAAEIFRRIVGRIIDRKSTRLNSSH